MFILESGNFFKGGVLLIYGKKLEDNTRRLYITTIKGFQEVNRFKKDNTEGFSNRNVVLGNQIYRLIYDGTNFKINGVNWGSNENIIKALGLTGNNIGLHYNKTPLHNETLKYKDIKKMLSNLGDKIKHIPDIRWIN